ncbi:MULTISPECIES: amino acid permease [unclassified Streptomyces]|uniref:amino acid permease n=1 Tax=unclassified Streptomyces TaxID=2593676 RepID=UPI00225A88C9|nr:MULTISPECIES: amino acid permease [unclassified Streptomyces]MCX4835101.1 amino acid permease [Streptomyces sp. NBC_01016]
MQHPPPEPSPAAGATLTQGLKGRQITMISIGGVIGAGLFVGSSAAVATAGPAVIVSFLLAAALVVLVMQMLGEMAVANPDTGSFSTYADRALGRWAGFSIGYLYWWFYILVIPIEAIAAGEVVAGLTSIPSWIPALAVILVLTGSNLLAVRNYGEFEYWFSLIKVVAIVAFLVLGALAVLGVLPGSDTHGVSNLWSHGGFAPQGVTAILAGLLTAMFSFQGSEIVTIAAAESEEPRKNIKKAIRAVVWRLGLFYIGSILVVVCLVPWNADDLGAGSYQAVLDRMNIPGAARIMDVVLVVAVCSCLNSAVYTASRMLFSLAGRGDAPAAFARTSPHGVPRNAVLASTVVGIAAVIANYLLPDVFSYLIASSGAIALMMYMVIALTQYAVRRKGDRPTDVRMWGFPYLTLATIAFIAGVLVLMAVLPGHRLELWLSLGLAAVLATVGVVRQRRGATPTATTEPVRATSGS